MPMPISMPCSRLLRRVAQSLPRRIGQYLRDERGVTALEFVIILPLFLTFVFMIIELGIAFAAQELMDNAARDAARLIRIGTYTGSSYSAALKSGVCSSLAPTGVTLISGCTGAIQIYVAAAASGTPAGTGFTQLSVATASGGVMTPVTEATLGPKYDVLLQIGLNYPWMQILSLGGNSMMMSTVAFLTEAYN